MPLSTSYVRMSEGTFCRVDVQLVSLEVKTVYLNLHVNPKHRLRVLVRTALRTNNVLSKHMVYIACIEQVL